MTNMQPFCFEGNEVRTIIQDGEPLFVAKDVCDVLGYKRSTDAVKQHCRGAVNHRPILDSLGRTQNVRVIDEPDLYRLVIGSKLPAAEKFERWIFEEVLPTIRKTGSYVHPNSKEVNIKHSRRTEAPGGLDIRYNLDLTKVITKPTPAGLEILSRLTGISFADIDLGGNSLDHRATFQMFVDQTCIIDPESRVHSPELFQRYLEWTDPSEAMTETKFHEVARTFFKRIKNNVYYYVGLRFVVEH